MILEKVKNTIKRYNLIQSKDKLVVGVSGGPDSVALLYLLNALKKEFKLNLHIAHLDHMLRKDSAKDAEFVKNLAGKLKLPISVGKVKVRKLAKKGSLEEAARNARFNFFFKIAKNIKAKKIALAHNLDDQAETVLMRILRGTGLYGLAGILPKRKICGYEVVRPLIEIRRRQIEAFLKQKKIKPRLDASNLSNIYLRNKLRNKLLPLLETEYNRNIKQALSNLAESSGYDYDYLDGVTKKIAKNRKTGINLHKFSRLHPAIRRLLLRLNIARLKGDTRRITLKHIREIEDLISRRPHNSIVDLPAGISVIKQGKSLNFYRR